MKNIAIARKSLVAQTRDCAGRGSRRTIVTVKRPGSGLSPVEYWDMIGTPPSRDFDEDEPISR